MAGDTDAVLSNRQFDTVGGGFNNAAGGGASTVGGGFSNQALGGSSTVPGGEDNRAIGNYSTAFGVGSRAGEASVAMGNNAYATHAGSFVFSDNTFVRTSTGAPNQFIARARGGVYFFTGGTNDANYTGAYLPTGGTAWVVYSDRDGKKGVASVDPEDVLRKLAAMPISTWQWNAEPGSVRHMGPMAQDFHAAFGLGTTPKGIATVDADGVALAAIQGLNAKLETKLAEANSQIAELRRAMAALAARVDATR